MRTEGDLIHINKALLPLSWLYGIGVGIRNMLFDMNILNSEAYSVPVISVGNITVGGTGKTPHVEYLINLFKNKSNVAVLSRGYKRKSKGFVMAGKQTRVEDIGDEPYQMKQKFPAITMAVDKNRRHGIKEIMEGETGKDIDVILLDDAFQHRYVKPGINILLVDYHRLVIYDTLLPAGRLREPVKSKDRADIVIVTKCPHDLKPMEFRVITKAMNLFPFQQLFFSTFVYDDLQPLFPKLAKEDYITRFDALADKHVLLLTGIASPEQMKHDLLPHAASLTPLSFSDHHAFKPKDIERLNEAFQAMESPKVIITTEKDAVRLFEAEGISEEVKRFLYMLPVRVSLMQDQEETFNNFIIGYVRKNSKNSILAKVKNGNKSKNSYNTGNGTRTISFRDNKQDGNPLY